MFQLVKTINNLVRGGGDVTSEDYK